MLYNLQEKMKIMVEYMNYFKIKRIKIEKINRNVELKNSNNILQNL